MLDRLVWTGCILCVHESVFNDAEISWKILAMIPGDMRRHT